MVCDYRALNKITIPDANPLPMINEALDQVSHGKIFSQIDLVGAYHQMRIKEEDCHKTAIRTRYGSFEWRVLCFGLMNAPAAFTRLLSSLLSELHGECLILYLDDILVYSSSVEEHKIHLRKLFDILHKNKLYIKPSKCTIGVDEVDFLGHKVNAEGIYMQSKLMSAILDWPQPQSLKDVQKFLGLANYYRKFIKEFARIVQPISDLLRRKTFIWSSEQEKSFTNIKQALTSATVLAHPRSDAEFVLSTDASQYAVGATLEQNGHPIAYLSHRLSPAEANWDTGDQELLAVMIALREWNLYLRGRPFKLRTDLEPIRYLQSKSRLVGRQARWLDELQSYSFTVEHVPGIRNIPPDALSRRPDHNVKLKAINLSSPDFAKRIQDGYKEDSWAQDLLKSFRDGEPPVNKKVAMYITNYAYQDNLILWNGTTNTRVYVPNCDTLRADVVSGFHDTGHLGVDKIYSSCARYAYWPGMYKDVEQYIASCNECQANKERRSLPAGKLQPHSIPNKCWEVVTTDFVSEFPESSNGFDSVLVIVDKLSKRAIFIPTKKTIDTVEVTQLFHDHLFSKHGVPVTLILDRDKLFKSNYFKGLMELINIRLNMATKDHPQTDGQSENMICTLSAMLRSSIQKMPHQWHTMLSELEFIYNSSKNASTGLAPFEVDIGYIPHSPFTRSLANCTTKCQAAIDAVAHRKTCVQLARENLANAIARQKFYADKKRRRVTFKVGDLVCLRVEGIGVSTRADLPKKWRPKYMGPFSVLEVMGPVIQNWDAPFHEKSPRCGKGG